VIFEEEGGTREWRGIQFILRFILRLFTFI